jgi:hypothetical protein
MNTNTRHVQLAEEMLKNAHHSLAAAWAHLALTPTRQRDSYFRGISWRVNAVLRLFEQITKSVEENLSKTMFQMMKDGTEMASKRITRTLFGVRDARNRAKTRRPKGKR